MHKIKGRADHISSCKKWHNIYSITERNIAKIMTDDYSSICYLKQRINWYLDFAHWSQWQSGISILKCTCEGYPDQWKCAHIIVCLSMGCMACIYKIQIFQLHSVLICKTVYIFLHVIWDTFEKQYSGELFVFRGSHHAGQKCVKVSRLF